MLGWGYFLLAFGPISAPPLPTTRLLDRTAPHLNAAAVPPPPLFEPLEPVPPIASHTLFLFDPLQSAEERSEFERRQAKDNAEMDVYHKQQKQYRADLARYRANRGKTRALQARSERYVAEIFHGLRDVSVASRANKPIGDRMIMNAAFLVSRATEEAFDARVKEIGSRYDKLTFKYTGPWPPYNFVNIRLKLERAH